MKKITITTLASLLFLIAPVFYGNAQMMQDILSDDHTAREEDEGKIIWAKLQSKELNCEDLFDDDFGALGEYYMGQMTGTSHEAMNNMMIQMMGEEGEEQMHVVMGKRLSGCDTSAAFPSQGVGFMPMMQMMMGGGNNSMMGNWGAGSWFVSFLWLVWLIVGILAVVWLWKQITKK